MSDDPHTDDHATLAAPAPPEPAGPARLTVPPWVQLVGLPLAVLFGYLFVRAASHAVVVFMIAGLISLLLAPVVRRLNRGGIPRLPSVLMVFGTFAAIVTVLTVVAVDLLAEQAVEVRDNAPAIGNVAVERIDDIQAFLDKRGVEVDLRDQGVSFVEQLEERSTELSGEALDYGREFVTIVAEAAFNLVLIIVITIYMLLDAPRISRLFASLLPPDSGVEQLFGRLERSLLRYTVGQTLASVVMGLSATIGLFIIGRVGIWEQADDYAVLFGLIVAVTEFAPSIGPAIGSIPPIATAIFDGVGPAIAVALFFVLLHQIEGHIVIPKLMGAAIAVHPLLVIFGILAGAQVMGIGGILLALPLLAVGREIVLFFRERIALDSWPGPLPAAGLVPAGAAGMPSAAMAPQDASGAATPAAPMRGTVRLRAMLARRRARSADDVQEPEA
ncbi:MAG: family transporter [Thermoleophilia bacterium]|nr:family transporter [Thermoleophilia bacterium]